MKLVVRLILAGSLLTSGAMVVSLGPALATHIDGEPITVTCTMSNNGKTLNVFTFTRTVSAHAAWGVQKALERFAARSPSPWGAKWECQSDYAGDAQRPDVLRRKTVTCERGDRVVFQRTIPRPGAKLTTRVLNRFHQFKASGVTCSLG